MVGDGSSAQVWIEGIEMMGWIITALALAGNVLVIRRSRWGFACWFGANIYLCWHNFSIDERAQGALFGVYLGLAAWGFIRWKK